MTTKIDTTDFKNLVFGKTFTDHMTISRYSDKKWEEPKLMPYGPIELAPSISALHYGQAVFEGMKAFANAKGEVSVFRPSDHSKRLNRSLARLAMPEIPEELFLKALNSLLKTDAEWIRRAGQVYLRPFVFATEAFLGVKVSEEYLFMILACPIGGAYYSKPLNLKVETEYSRSAPGGVGFAKAAGNYAASMHPTRKAQQEGFDQLIWTDAATHSYIEESGTMNIMCVINGTLVTPSLSETILSGLTRDSLLTIARDLGIKVEERKISVTELVEGLEKGTVSEVFGAGTAVTVARCATVTYQGKKYEVPDAGENAVAQKLHRELDAIKRGEKPDRFGWMQKIA